MRQAALTKYLRAVPLLDATYATQKSMSYDIEIVPILTVISFFCKFFLPSLSFYLVILQFLYHMVKVSNEPDYLLWLYASVLKIGNLSLEKVAFEIR